MYSPMSFGRGRIPSHRDIYAYVSDSPVLATDPLGLFLSQYHSGLSVEALQGSGLDQSCVGQAVAAAILWDYAPGSQGVALAYTHSMAQPGQSATAAAAQANQFIYDEIATCNCIALGVALHTAQDSAAGGHQYETYNGFLNLGMIWHFIQDEWPSKNRLTEALVKSKNVVNEFKRTCKSCGK
jgi:hypothetical protein